MRNVHPVDELADIRAQMKELRERETEIRTQVLARRTPLVGVKNHAEIVEEKRRILLSELLPDEVLENPYYWGVSKLKTIKLRRLIDSERDFQVIEPFRNKRPTSLDDFLRPIVSSAKR